MPEWLEKYGEVIKWISGVGGALAVIWAWFARPLKDVPLTLEQRVAALELKVAALESK